MDSKNIKYLILTIILLILSIFGTFLIFKINSSPLSLFYSSSKNNSDYNQKNLLTPEEIIPTVTSIIEITPVASPSVEPTITKNPIATSTPTPVSTIIPTPIATSSSSILFKSIKDNFSINYDNSRKVYEDKQTMGNRYTFYNPLGNFAVHVSPSGSWSWINSNRVFSSDFVVSGQNTFKYEINTQTIVDLQSNDKNYTLQCIHNGKESLKNECESFIKSFQFL